MYSFDSQIASRGWFIVKPHNGKPDHKLKVERETNNQSNLYACAIKIKHQFFETWLTMRHIPREISRHCCFIYGRRW